MFKRSLRGAVLSASAALATALLTPGTAQAATPDITIYITNSFTNVASISYHDDGDKFTVCDLYGDSHGVRGSLYHAGDRVATKYNGLGSGNCTTFTYDVKAAAGVYDMQVCLVDGSSDTTGSSCEHKHISE
ncbi:hypothetical protein [Actinoplanes regularis]|uniref:hypothetical protein n=1 Tax=Actinoplanes regularis TaxID=52697 RepID=UPI00255235BF|nr:hypothetical protein [Actinoplanes regularis]GLW31688.1 hypothetical protein Areg01_46280 [Actinoplanes regularis]